MIIKEFFSQPRYCDADFLHQKYAVEGLSVAQIATQIVSSKEAVRNNLIKQGLILRSPSQHHGHPAQPKFGTKVIKGRKVDHKTELRIISAVQEMREQGMGYRAIARSLQGLKIPTKCRGKSWHPEMVKRILSSTKDVISARV